MASQTVGADIHIVDFYWNAARTLHFLYESFPRKVSIWVQDFVEDQLSDDFGLPTPKLEAAHGMVLWLQEQGYIRYEDVDEFRSFNFCCLSQNGLLALTRAHVLEGGHDPVRVIDLWREAFKCRDSNLLELGFTLFWGE